MGRRHKGRLQLLKVKSSGFRFLFGHPDDHAFQQVSRLGQVGWSAPRREIRRLCPAHGILTIDREIGDLLVIISKAGFRIPASVAMSDMKKRQHPGRSGCCRGTLAQGGGRAAYGCGKAREEERPLPPTIGPWGGGEVRRIGCRKWSGYVGAASSGRRMPPVPALGRRTGRKGLYLTSCPRRLREPGG